MEILGWRDIVVVVLVWGGADVAGGNRWHDMVNYFALGAFCSLLALWDFLVVVAWGGREDATWFVLLLLLDRRHREWRTGCGVRWWRSGGYGWWVWSWWSWQTVCDAYLITEDNDLLLVSVKDLASSGRWTFFFQIN